MGDIRADWRRAGRRPGPDGPRVARRARPPTRNLRRSRTVQGDGAAAGGAAGIGAGTRFGRTRRVAARPVRHPDGLVVPRRRSFPRLRRPRLGRAHRVRCRAVVTTMSALLAAFAAYVWVTPPPPTVRGRTRVSRIALHVSPAMAAAVFIAIASVTLLGFPMGAVVALVAAPAGAHAVGRLETAEARRRRERVERDMPLML